MRTVNQNKIDGFYSKYLKRLLDILASFLIGLILIIPLLIIALLIKIDSKGPVIFKQSRVGKNGKTFNIYKFRTMEITAPHNMATSNFNNAKKYITRTGAFLRKSSIDEIPQLLSVLKGDMSIVGPRPLILSEKMVNRERHRLGIDQVLPGITGLAQISGRDMIDDQAKVEYDFQYVQHLSFILDVKIIISTLLKVAIEKDIHEGND